MRIDQLRRRRLGRPAWTVAAACAVLGLTGCGSNSSTATAPATSAASPITSATSAGGADPVQKVVLFAKTAAKPSKAYSLAFLSSCATENTYCQSGVAGIEAAAHRFGATVHVYDPQFNPATQQGQVQDAVSHGYDGYILEPAASAPACSMWHANIQSAGSPVVVSDLPICNAADYTSGTAGIVTMQRLAYFQEVVDNAFASCHSACQLAAVGGFAGSDLFTYWQDAIKAAQSHYPNVHVVSDQPANFDARNAFNVVQDALRANPKLSVVISSWDAMTQGAVQAIKADGKRPGTDVRVYSVGGTRAGVDAVKAGTWNATYVLLPYQEGYYATVALIMALEGHPVNAFVNEAELPAVQAGPKTVIITKANAARFDHPDY